MGKWRLTHLPIWGSAAAERISRRTCGSPSHPLFLVNIMLFFVRLRQNTQQRLAKMLSTHLTLNTGAKIPVVGFGTWQAAPHEVEHAVEEALKQGYRHIDCAAIYRNETEVGAGIKKSGIPREEIVSCAVPRSGCTASSNPSSSSSLANFGTPNTGQKTSKAP